ncbi:MAG: glucosamine-6-phosphate deaminase [Clostridia bacterium]|nr:glucosamine-6-phosphate deaminase [Clostridia bacterium]
MNIRIFDTAQEAAIAGAEIIAEVIKSQDKTVLGLATGSTPVAMYKELIKKNAAGELDFTNVYSYNLDEYIGLDGTHDQSYRYFMNDNLFNHININKENTHVPCGTGADHAADAAAYDAAIEAEGGIDVQVLGIGNNGHIGFNEPSNVFYKGTHVVDLTDSTIDANKRFFANRDEVPKQAITLGVGGIMNAKKVILLAYGKGKAEAVKALVKGEIDPQCQASILQIHKDTTLLLDKEAASLL